MIKQQNAEAPFLTSAQRFPAYALERNAHLGPNTYEMGNWSLADQSAREAEYKKTLKGAFNTKCARKLKLISSNSVGWTWTDAPGPGSYKTGSVHRPISVFGNSVFTSRASRMEKNLKEKDNYPASADYSVRNYCISKDIRDDNTINRNMKKYLTSSQMNTQRYPAIGQPKVQRKPEVRVVKYQPGGREKGRKPSKPIYCNTNIC